MSQILTPYWPLQEKTLALVAPSGSFSKDKLEAGLRVLSRVLPKSKLRMDQALLRKNGYLAGSDQTRAKHFTKLMLDPNVSMVFSIRGGFGASRILPLLDLKKIAKARKCFMGFSDITCLLNPLADNGLTTVHGPSLTQLPNLDEPSLKAVQDLLNGVLPWPLKLKGKPISPEKATGKLMGGNLTMLCHLLGTPYFPDLKDCVLFIEDRGERPYRLDRLMTQLSLAGVLEKVVGICVGDLGGEDQEAENRNRAVAQWLENINKPVVMDLPYGHGPQNMPLPVGAQAILDGDKGTLSVGVDLA